jgi:hypothetical protein
MYKLTLGGPIRVGNKPHNKRQRLMIQILIYHSDIKNICSYGVHGIGFPLRDSATILTFQKF